MSIPLLFIAIGLLLLFYNSHWTLNFDFGLGSVIPIVIIVVGLLIAMKRRD